MHAEPVRLADHGTYIRAYICTDDCPKCGPIRARERERYVRRRARDLEASHERKRGRVNR